MNNLWKSIQRTSAICILFCFLTLLFSGDIIATSAAISYNPDAALAYASEHWNESGPCAAFVSECLYRGGITSAYSNGDAIGSTTSLWEALTSLNIPSHKLKFVEGEKSVSFNSSANSLGLSAGDPMFCYCSSCGAYMHVAICAGADSSGKIIGYAHNNPTNAESPLYLNRTCYECETEYVYYSLHINYSTGKINIDFHKDGAVWNDPPIGSASYVINKASGKKYTMSQNPNYPYAYQTATNLPYGTYDVYIKNGTGAGAAAGREILAANSASSTLGNVSMGQIGESTVDWNAVLPNGGTITWDDLDWSLLDMDAIDWDTFTMEDLFRILLGNQTGNEVM